MQTRTAREAESKFHLSHKPMDAHGLAEAELCVGMQGVRQQAGVIKEFLKSTLGAPGTRRRFVYAGRDTVCQAEGYSAYDWGTHF